MRQPSQLDKDKQHIRVRKRWADTYLEFSSGFNMLVRWVAYMLRLPLGASQKLGLVNFRLLTFFMAGVLLSFCTLSRLAVNSRKDTSRPLTSAYHVGSRNIRFCSFHTCTHDPRISSLLLSFLITTNASALLFGDFCLLYLIIYLFIHSFNFNFQWAV